VTAPQPVGHGCVDSDTLVALLEGALPADRADELDAHVDGCAACAAVVAELGALTGGDGPRKVGRYVLERTLGAGAMGVVWAAWDPELQRRVAVKLVKGKSGAPRETVARARMVREARALARINHPNVVAVHDVGEHDGEVFVATELVDGETMAQWQLGRGWREVVLAWVQAARGLAAAHAEGLVHRDVKPANVFVGRDGRVRVGDFGLARTDISDAPTEDSIPAEAVAEGSVDENVNEVPQLTATGHVAGTPGYMAPEQRRGPVDARADQFALCVAIVEALAGRRPAADARPAIRDVPAELVDVLARGLRAEPADRYPTIAALGDALAAAAAEPSVTTAAEPAAVKPKSLVPILAGGGILLAAAGVGIALVMRDPEPPGQEVAQPAPAPTPRPDPAPVVVTPAPAPAPAPTPTPAPTIVDADGPKPAGPRTKKTPSPSPSPSPSTSTASLDPMATPTLLAYATFTDKAGQDAQAARDKDDGAACLASLGSASADDAPPRVVLRGTCEMMVGKCAEGKKRIRTLPWQNAVATDMGIKWLDRLYCPSTEGDFATRVHRFEAQVVLGPRVGYSIDRYIAQLEKLTGDPDLAKVKSDSPLSDGETAIAKAYYRIVPLLRSMKRCADAASLAARAEAAGIHMPDDPTANAICP
jgi:serine/threonine protein kinase